MKEIEKWRSEGTPPTEVRVPSKAIITDIFSVLVGYISFGFWFGQKGLEFSLSPLLNF